MKGLDTPVLEALLRGDRKVLSALRRLDGEEICTTSVNLFELEVAARAGPSSGRERRIAAVERLQRKLTLLDVSPRSARYAALQWLERSGRGRSAQEALLLGAFESAGCNEILTTSDSHLSSGSKGVKVTRIQ